MCTHTTACHQVLWPRSTAGSRDQRTPGDQIVTTYLHAFNALALNGITQLHTSHRNHSVQACFSLLLRPCKVHPLPASKTHCVPGVPPPVAATIPHATPTSLHEPMQRVQVYPHQYVHPQRLRARTSSSTFGACQERLQRGRDKRVPTDHTHKQTPFACVRNYVLAYKAPVCRQMVVITGFYYHFSLIPYTGYSVQIPHLVSNLDTACL